MTRVAVNPELLNWALHRAGLQVDGSIQTAHPKAVDAY